jgi:CBS domain
MTNPDDSKILSLKGCQLIIRDLLAVWGERVRGLEANQRISLDLDRHGLTTVPAFDVGPSDTLIEVVPLGTPGAQPPADESAPADQTTADEDPLSAPPQSKLQVGFLPTARSGTNGLPSQSTLEQALALMLIGQRSQIPVIDEPYTLHGVVSYKGIGQAHAANKQQTLDNAMNCDPEVIRVSDDLLEVAPRILEHGYALVRDADNSYCGMVTVDDLARQFLVMAGPFFLVGEIERRLRRLLNKTYAEADFRALTNQKHGTADELVFSQYMQLISPVVRWQKLGWNIDRQLFVAHLDIVRKVRNQIMHFHPTPMTEAEQIHLKALRQTLLVLDPD